MSGTKGVDNNNLPGFIQPSEENHLGSNPTPGAFGSTPGVDSRYDQQIELNIRNNQLRAMDAQRRLRTLNRQILLLPVAGARQILAEAALEAGSFEDVIVQFSMNKRKTGAFC